jgi:hypothetical protein
MVLANGICVFQYIDQRNRIERLVMDPTNMANWFNKHVKAAQGERIVFKQRMLKTIGM